MAASVSKTFRLVGCQFKVVEDKLLNLATAKREVMKAVEAGAGIVVLPEIWNGPYSTSEFRKFAEEVPENSASLKENVHPSCFLMSSLAKTNKVYIVGGSIPEVRGGDIYNTCVVFDPTGEIVTKYSKMHLFDIDIPGKQTFKESDTLTAGNKVVFFTTPWCKIGLGICYDMRFPHLASLLRQEGCSVLIYPGAFNVTTGPQHWELLLRSMAVNNQLYVAGISPANNPDAGYQAWGHSSIIHPRGKVLSTCEMEETIVQANIDLDEVASFRTQVPISKQLRHDIYMDVTLQGKNGLPIPPMK